MRGMFSILVLAAVIAVGLWYWRGQSDTPVTPGSETAEPTGDATAAVGSRTNEPGAEGVSDASRTAESGAATPAGATRPADPGATGSTIEQAGSAIREQLVPEPGVDADTATSTAPVRTMESGAAPAPGVARTAEAEATAARTAEEAEAKQYVATLPTTSPPTIPVDKADHFVTGEHVVSLVPEEMIESVSVGALAEDDTLEAETPITVVQEVEQIETVGPEQLIAESGGDLDAKLHVLVEYGDAGGDAERKVAVQGDTGRGGDGSDSAAPGGAGESAGEAVEEITVREALERLRSEPEKPITLIKTVRYFEVMTLRELLDAEEDTGAFLDVVTQPYRIEAVTLADLLQRQKAGSSNTIFYLHTVQPTDEQGIWGIVQSGLVDNFARGMAVRRGEAVETYTVRIPGDADERLHDQSSSFLGRLIDRKTEESFVYNYRDDRMGRNPDRIYPGQEIVIIKFEPEELVSIYRHFAGG